MLYMITKKFGLKGFMSSYGKAALAYLLCEIMIRGINFISTPIFTRIMDASAYGQFSNFVAWEALLTPLLTMNLRITVSKSKYDFANNNDIFLSSILAASNIITLVFWIVVELNKSFFCGWLGMDMRVIRLLLLYLLLWPAFAFQQIQFQMYNKYKLYVVYSVMTTIIRMGVSVILVLFMADQMLGRVYGYVVPAVTVYLIIYVNIWRRGKRIDINCIKYALRMSIPLVPSTFSVTILISSDQIMIKYWCGSEDLAIYSLAYSISSIAGIIWTAMNQAWSPWMLDHLNDSKFDDIKKMAVLIQSGYAIIIGFFIIVAPEVVLVMGGSKYADAIKLMPPVIMAMVCQFFYAFYYNVEYFYGKKIGIILGTPLAAIVNVVLNLIFIPRYGYVAASYTTLVGYMIMLLCHYIMVKHFMKKGNIFPNKLFFTSILGLACFQLILAKIYDGYLIRYCLLFVCVVAVSLIGMMIVKKHYLSNYNARKE